MNSSLEHMLMTIYLLRFSILFSETTFFFFFLAFYWIPIKVGSAYSSDLADQDVILQFMVKLGT
jgi:hypothetical protein